MANQGKKSSEFPEAHNPNVQAMQECMSVCVACAKKCLDEGYKKTAAVCADCADVCSLAIKATSGHSNFERDIMDLCATVCKSCAEECKKIQVKHCQECSDVCHHCAEACSGAHSKH
jgi:hypothetical protein